jgi:hypothetical protein
MSTEQVIAAIEAMPEEEQARILEHFRPLAEADIPASFRRGMAQALAGQGVDMETALSSPPPSRARSRFGS